jgi:hypothetical protein
MWSKPDFESIIHVTGKDVQMNVKYFLPCSLAVRKADIHAFTLDPAITQRHGKTPRDAKHLRAFFLVQLRKVTGMPVRNYKRMAGVDGLMVQKSRAAIVLIDHADFKLARKYLAKYAVIRLAHGFRPWQSVSYSQNTGSASFANTAAEAFSTSACSELPWASMVTMAGKSVTRSRHIASGMPNSSSFTSTTSSMHLA